MPVGVIRKPEPARTEILPDVPWLIPLAFILSAVSMIARRRGRWPMAGMGLGRLLIFAGARGGGPDRLRHPGKGKPDCPCTKPGTAEPGGTTAPWFTKTSWST